MMTFQHAKFVNAFQIRRKERQPQPFAGTKVANLADRCE